MGALSRGFVLLLPLAFHRRRSWIIAFFGGLRSHWLFPAAWSCTSNTAPGLFNVGCPFCFITYQYPLLWGVIPAYSVSIALVVWNFLFRRSSKNNPEIRDEILGVNRKVVLACIILAVTGTVLLVLQMALGAFSNA